MVSSTASLVEKQLGLGITLAKFAEHTLLDVTELRSAAPGALLPRVRGDAHELLDMFADAVTMATKTFSGQTRGIIDVTSRAQAPRSTRSHTPAQLSPDQAAAGRLVVVQMPGPLAPGQAGERALVMTNETDTPTGEMSFSSSDLVGPSGAWIPGSLVSFDPVALSIPPRESGRVVVRVTIPEGLPGGGYEGLLQGIRVEGQETLLRVDVA